MLEPLARLGYASKAVIYGIVGVLAVLTVTRRGGTVTDTDGALRVALTQPFGRILLAILAVGLFGYALWRVLDAIKDPDRDGTSATGLVTRIGNFIRGCVYGALGFEAARLLRGFGQPNTDEAELWTARLLDFPLGAVVVGVAGGIVSVYGISEIVRSARGHDPKVDWSPIRADLRRPLQRISRFGVAMRGGLLATLGVFLVRAAIDRDPNQAAGSRESMLRLAGVFEGQWFLGVVAVGVIAYAVDQAIHARCRRIRPVL